MAERMVAEPLFARPPETLPGEAAPDAPPAPAPTAGEKFMRLAYRLGVPGPLLCAPLAKPAPLRLLATVANPLPGDKVAGIALRAGHFLVQGNRLPFAEMGKRLSGPGARIVHGFTWLDDLEAAAPREAGVETAVRLMRAWLEANPGPATGPAWDVEVAASRLQAWLVHAPLILSVSDRAYRAQVLRAIAETAHWLDGNVRRSKDPIGSLCGWAAIIAAGLLLPHGKPRRLFGEAGLARALDRAIGPDGGVLSRSPLLQMDAIAALVRLRACYQATRRDPPEWLEARLTALVPPLLTVLAGDGGLGAWQGAPARDAAPVNRLIAATGIRTRPLKDVGCWGYRRLEAGRAVLTLDAAPPPVSPHSRSGCASTLAFTFDDAGQRIVVNCGGAAVSGGLIPTRLADALRATAAHSTLILDETNSTALLPKGGLGKGVGAVSYDCRSVTSDEGKPATLVETGHDGYVARYGLRHERDLMLHDDGRALIGEDRLIPSGRQRRRGETAFAVRFHLAPVCRARMAAGRLAIEIALPDGAAWRFSAGPGNGLVMEESLWVDGQGRPVEAQQIVIQGMVSREGTIVPWRFDKMG